MDLIARLYGVEKALKDHEPEARHAQRQIKARPLLEEIHAWLEQALSEVPPSTLTGKALTYLQNQWPKLIGYLDDGRLEIDKNACERAMRPFVIGRRNWLFADTPAVGHRLGQPLLADRNRQGQRPRALSLPAPSVHRATRGQRRTGHRRTPAHALEARRRASPAAVLGALTIGTRRRQLLERIRGLAPIYLVPFVRSRAQPGVRTRVAPSWL